MNAPKLCHRFSVCVTINSNLLLLFWLITVWLKAWDVECCTLHTAAIGLVIGENEIEITVQGWSSDSMGHASFNQEKSNLFRKMRNQQLHKPLFLRAYELAQKKWDSISTNAQLKPPKQNCLPTTKFESIGTCLSIDKGLALLQGILKQLCGMVTGLFVVICLICKNEVEFYFWICTRISDIAWRQIMFVLLAYFVFVESNVHQILSDSSFESIRLEMCQFTWLLF